MSFFCSNPSQSPFTAQNLAMILFAFGGIGSLTNASYNLNFAIHNTMWASGHFHLTVGSAVTLTFFGITYWLVPKLANKPLFSRKLGLWQSWTWFVGMLLMSNGLHVTVLQKKTLEEPIEMPVAEPYHPEETVPGWLDAWKPWIAVTVLLILVAYGPILFDMLSNIQLTSPGFKPW